MKSLNEKLTETIKWMIYILPLVLFFSYYPLIHFGASESMNFEISLPLIWLVLFDVFSFFVLIKRKKLLRGLRGKWVWLLFPAFLTISVFWSLNSLRGFLTVGIVWLLYFAGYAMFSFKAVFDKDFSERFFKWFFGSTLLICFWCLLQSVLDLIGVAREFSLMCEGCTYTMFGFPHPNGFAIEPQFMGNLLIAPGLVAGWFVLKKRDVKKMLVYLFIIGATLFLTFSRGAIYAFIVALIFMIAFFIAREKKEVFKRVGVVLLTVVLAFLFTLNLQGIMAAVSPTNDNYRSGVAKVLNHLSLGKIDIREKKSSESSLGDSEKTEAVFNGYVEESTNTRLRLADAATKVWAKDFTTVMFGVGLGGAGQALYINDLSPAPKEIVQNQYFSLLLETGVIGVLLFVVTVVLMVRAICKRKEFGMVLSIVVAYGLTLLFFSGLPNALHIYLLPMVLVLV